MAKADDEWTVVGRKGAKGRGPRRRPGRAPRSGVADILDKEAVNGFRGNSNPQLSVPDIEADHERICKGWRESSACQTLRTTFTDHVTHHVPIETAICLGLGSFDPGPERPSWQRDAHIQLEAFLIIVQILERYGGKKIKCYAQEPSFVPNDGKYLESLGIETVDNPEAFQHVNGQTLVYGIHLPHPVWGHVLKEELPGLCVGTNSKGLESFMIEEQDTREVIDKILAKIRKMEETSDKFIFPEAAGHHTFSGTDIYWTKRTIQGIETQEGATPKEETETASKT